MKTSLVVQLRSVAKDYVTPAGKFTALQHIDLDVKKGEFVAVVGQSGSGKTTLLNVLAGIDRPTAGKVIVSDEPIEKLSESELARWRAQRVGLVFQFFQLLPTLTVAENIVLAMDFGNKIPSPERRKRALDLLEQVGIKEQADKLPSTLSGGQQQRAAIARAIANDPPLLLCDEPTGNLDSVNRTAILELFRTLNKKGHTIVMVTHEVDASEYTNRQITLVDGRVVDGDRR